MPRCRPLSPHGQNHQRQTLLLPDYFSSEVIQEPLLALKAEQKYPSARPAVSKLLLKP